MAKSKTITREFVTTLTTRLAEPTPLIQVVLGPRQVGKTTGVQQLIEQYDGQALYASADSMISTPETWLVELWQSAKEKGPATLLVIDEIQKIHNWSETTKKLWDKEPKKGRLKVVLLGSSSNELQQGLTESLTGRFESIRVYHWSFAEFREAFRCNLEQFLIFGGYPASFQFKDDQQRWLTYVRESIIETVIAQDILSLRSISNPALFRQTFEILSSYPAQEVSYTKLLGQLQDKGNTDLIKRYIRCYEDAFLFMSLSKFSAKAHKVKSSSPKIVPLCPSLYTAQRGHTEPLESEEKGRVFELVVGADLIRSGLEPNYWREGSAEVDYVVKLGPKIIALEVKSGRKSKVSGMMKFLAQFPKAQSCFINFDNYENFSLEPRNFLASLT